MCRRDFGSVISRTISIGLAALLVMSLHLQAQQKSDSESIFRIGNFDRSSREFAKGDPEQPVNFVVGRSTASKDWYSRQPAVQSSSATAKDANHAADPRAITFSLDQDPAPRYQLRAGFIIISGVVPEMQVTINDKHGRFYLHPTLDYSNGEVADAFYSAYSYALIDFSFSGKLLHRGENQITLQAVEQEDQDAPDPYVTYDAIELERAVKDGGPQATFISIAPTIFYENVQNSLAEEVDVFIQHNQPANAGDYVNLEIDGKKYHDELKRADDFGEEKLKYSVAEFPANTQSKLNGKIAGHQVHQEQGISPQKKWTLFLVPHIHLDVGYSDYQAKVASIQARVLDEALDMIAQHPDFRFSTDGKWNLEQFMKTRDAADRQRAISAIVNKKLFVPANYANLLTGFPTAEVLLRSLYPSANFSREHQTDFNYATITDVPSFSWSYASILASAGINYLLSGSNNYRAPVLLQGHLNENSPFYWEGPDGNKVLLWYSRHYEQMQVLFGLPPNLSAGKDMLPIFLQQYARLSYRADAAILFGTQVENTDLFPQQAEFAQEWNRRYAYPKMQYAGFHEALTEVAKQFGEDIPTIRGDGGPYWEDGIGSDAYYAAMERQTETRAPSAEKLQILSSLVNPSVEPDKVALDGMWKDMVLMDEHTMDSFDSVSSPASMQAVKQLQVKHQFAVQAQAKADFLARNAMSTLTDSISVGSGNLVVFNTLNWKRNGEVTVDISKGKEIVDPSDGQKVLSEVLSEGPDFQHVRFIARDVPATGYKIFELRTAKQARAVPATANATTIESPFYRVKLDPATGAVSSIFDKQLQRELVNQESPYRFGQYLYVTSDTPAPNRLLQYGVVYPKADIQIHPAADGHLLGISQTPDGYIARMESKDTNTPRVVTEIRLFNLDKKIEFIEEVEKKQVEMKEAVYFAFPFSMPHPQFQYEIQTGVVDPATDMYPGAGREWFSVQHWVAVQQDGLSAAVMPLDAPLITLGDINRGTWPTEFGDRPGNVFSYVMNNYWDTNYRAAQGGHFRFRYVITSSSTVEPAKLSRLGWEETTPLESNIITSQDKAFNQPRPLDGKQYSFLQTDDQELFLEDWKPAENGDGTILRFLDLGGTTRRVGIHIPILRLQKVWKTDSVERNLEPLPLIDSHGFEITVHPQQILTVRIIGKDAEPAPCSSAECKP